MTSNPSLFFLFSCVEPFLRRRRKLLLNHSVCGFRVRRLLTSEMLFAPRELCLHLVKFSATALVVFVCFFFSWACLLCCFFTRYENNLPCVEVKVTKFFRVPTRTRRTGIVLTAATTFTREELGQSVFPPIHWAIIYWDEFQRATE